MPENQSTRLTFLGTGGGRFATMYQTRATGGIYLADNIKLHLDPGPSALHNMKCAAIDPAKTDGLLLSHCHPDHYSDAEVLVEGMSKGGIVKRGALIGSESVILGEGEFDSPISTYHKSICSRVSAVTAGDRFRIGNTVIDATPTQHSDPYGVGFRIHTRNGIVSYVSDSEITDKVVAAHRGARVLILNLTRPLGAKVPYHLCTEEAALFAREIVPEMVLLTHFGMKLLREGVNKQVKYIKEHSGTRVIAAEDLMRVSIGKDITVKRLQNPANR
ncbi:MBL fold metallo-hydrolase [Candidatus Methanomassiliicoccus intestinalis]|uniref:MBL fold metallo-hydrolase n=1 Tax=Candidatus Methanomassiliicoccus intestinalis TaxID=1406512 RepID=UPI0037DCD843